jgi:hypothetical protein
MSIRNSLSHLEGASALFAAGKTTAADASTYTLTTVKSFKADIVIAKSATGIYTITITPFKGPQGLVSTVVGLFGANSGIARVDSEVYTGNNLVITVKTFAVDGTTATDKQFSFQTFAV